MYLSNTQRVLKVLCHLTRRPHHLLAYLRHSLTSRSPLDFGLPWWSLNAIEAVEEILTPKTTVLEWGSGGSTLFLARRAATVTSVEHLPEWRDKVESALKQENIANANVLLRELNIENQAAFESCPYAEALDSTKDLIIVDGEDQFGPDSEWSARESCFRRAEQWIRKPGGVIVVDDSWRYPRTREESKAKKTVIHESIGPCRRGVTSTDIHYY